MANFVVSKPNTRGFTVANDIEVVDYSGGDVPLDHVSLLLIGTTGTLKVDTAEGSTVTLPAAVITAVIAGGGILRLFCTKVYQTGTTATNIWALKP